MNTIIEQAIKKYPKAKKIAVENATMGQTDSLAFRMNLSADAACYKWNRDTLQAINFIMANKDKI